jgi:hypothetical protein
MDHHPARLEDLLRQMQLRRNEPKEHQLAAGQAVPPCLKMLLTIPLQ